MHIGASDFKQRGSIATEDGSDRAKINKAHDYATALKQLLTHVDLPALHGDFYDVIHRHRKELEPKVSESLTKLFSGARELVDTLTTELKTLPIPKFEFTQHPDAQPTDDFWKGIKELGLNTEF